MDGFPVDPRWTLAGVALIVVSGILALYTGEGLWLWGIGIGAGWIALALVSQARSSRGETED